MAVSATHFPKLHCSFSAVFECRSDPDFSSGGGPKSDAPRAARFSSRLLRPMTSVHGVSSLILKFPPNFVRQLSNKARRNCSNIGVAQIVAASWTNDESHASGVPAPAAIAADAAASAVPLVPPPVIASEELPVAGLEDVQLEGSNLKEMAFLKYDGSLAIHAGERLGRRIVSDTITTPIFNTSAYFFKQTDELIDFKEKRSESFEYGRYGNPTTECIEKKISALERAETTVIMASGMCASIVLFSALVPAGGHIVTTTDCYRKTRIFIETHLPKMGIKISVIDPADIKGLESALEEGNVSLFFTESPTNPFLRCVDIELVSELCHRKGALVCIDGTFATPLNQKPLTLGADLVLHSLTKYIAGHNDVLGGCISGSKKLISEIRNWHHIFGGTINPFASYLIARGMKTLHLRVQQQNSTAHRMAEILEAHPKIERVYYPGLPSHPEHYLAKRQMKGFGGVVSFEVKGDFETTKKFIDALEIPYIAPSFGGCESIVDQPALMSYWDLPRPEREKYGIKDNLVRFSFGVEVFEDVKADILQALETV